MKLFVLGLYLTKFRVKKFLHFTEKERRRRLASTLQERRRIIQYFSYLCDTKAEIFLLPHQKEGQIGGS